MMRHVGGNFKRRTLESASVFFFREKENILEVLLAKRKPNMKAFPGLWAGIGGKISKTDLEFISSKIDRDKYSEKLKATAIREVYEELGLCLLREGVKKDENFKEIDLRDLGYAFEEFDWHGLIPSGLKITPEFTLTNPIFKTQFYLYKLPNHISLEINNSHPEFEAISWNSPQEWYSLFEHQQVRIPPPVLSLIRSFLPNNSPIQAAELSEQRNSLPIGLQTEIEFHPGIYGLPLQSLTIKPATTTNCGIIGDQDHRYIIDPGSHLESEQQRLLQVIDGLIAKEELKGILLTHHHKDHWSSVPFLQSNLDYNIPVFAHENTGELIGNSDITIDYVISSGQIFELGFDKLGNKWELEAIYTGGHCPDHYCFLDKRNNALLAGDFVAGAGTVIIEDLGQYLKSLDMLIERNIGVIFPGHGTFHYNGMKLLKKYKSHRLGRLDKILDSFKQLKGKTDLNELVKVAYDDVDLQYHEFAKVQLKTALNYLIEEGKVEKIQDNFRLTI